MSQGYCNGRPLASSSPFLCPVPRTSMTFVPRNRQLSSMAQPMVHPVRTQDLSRVQAQQERSQPSQQSQQARPCRYYCPSVGSLSTMNRKWTMPLLREAESVSCISNENGGVRQKEMSATSKNRVLPWYSSVCFTGLNGCPVEFLTGEGVLRHLRSLFVVGICSIVDKLPRERTTTRRTACRVETPSHEE